ncbi:MAG: hypothetical protein A2528_00085 [Candidatus Staskawiczbacteria bacterium RIFOXYD2_FULL_37_9]|uniref:Nucleotidyltransferase n=1 Tax=Candidatus Staskawiczbacteria bacterium RIFOXYB1_FULL_37_44 TaxID=1802223 RepID=A0A1G2ITN9_9BACT|nr:MAG: hypothetical protein A2358_02560 [Candidatus Staskawiczbacteria bacterium RIFOXYB1_FULL_37_44]OGZ84285.1 MAG: hypothetical protein A2416_01400 [Candidatus Staskawiczbacteria bacterium RIFOXYC1_FULL_37_52]OGZ89154.1 MAG: hypothetical protein A2581_01420 [Candidatus Staskawiczbacteria bacterium RIFOXYD1_FULL_37_110]OGZ89437.1 MAG: hypothetical protein A2444_04040 [Candidatus Staskawiczbacteria bacterium RIFOXYC2_FULL_37_19]OGZ94686.1 MAG: hypothetical protein A2528_00085 [Candidatus Stask
MAKYHAIKNQYLKSIKNLTETLAKEKTEERRDSAIKRFEICFDLAWKTIKAYMEEYKGTTCASPKECFKEGYRQKIFDYNEIWNEIADERNLAVHTYDEKFADALYKKLPKFLKLFQELKEKLCG